MKGKPLTMKLALISETEGRTVASSSSEETSISKEALDETSGASKRAQVRQRTQGCRKDVNRAKGSDVGWLSSEEETSRTESWGTCVVFLRKNIT